MQALWQELHLLCGLAVGIAPIARDLAAVLRRLVGADAAAVFWLDAEGMPEGFFHEDSPAAVQDLFLNAFEQLFVGPHEINVHVLARPDGPALARLLRPEAAYFRSNTYNLLVRASGHQHALDARVDAEGRTQAVVVLFRAPGQPFTEAQAQTLARAVPYVARAAQRGAIAHDLTAAERDAPVGHIVFDAQARRVVLVDDTAEQVLRGVNRVGLGLTAGAPGRLSAHTIERLGVRPGHTVAIPGPAGVVRAQAHALHAPGAGTSHWLIELQVQRPRQIDVIRRVLAWKLSPLQREIAVLAGLGRPRADCVHQLGVSAEALKKHLRAVFAESGANDWASLTQVLRG